MNRKKLLELQWSAMDAHARTTKPTSNAKVGVFRSREMDSHFFKWKFKTPWLLQVTSITILYIYTSLSLSLSIYTLLFGIFWCGNIFLNYSLQLLGVKVLRQECWALTIDSLGSPLVRFPHGEVPDLRTPSAAGRLKVPLWEESRFNAMVDSFEEDRDAYSFLR